MTFSRNSRVHLHTANRCTDNIHSQLDLYYSMLVKLSSDSCHCVTVHVRVRTTIRVYLVYTHTQHTQAGKQFYIPLQKSTQVTRLTIYGKLYFLHITSYKHFFSFLFNSFCHLSTHMILLNEYETGYNIQETGCSFLLVMILLGNIH